VDTVELWHRDRDQLRGGIQLHGAGALRKGRRGREKENEGERERREGERERSNTIRQY
jgi:hypothetical protein